MKCAVTKSPISVPEFPRLMTNNDGDTLLIFDRTREGHYSFGKGLVLGKGEGSNGWPVGTYHNRWCMEYLKDFDGSVTLSNK